MTVPDLDGALRCLGLDPDDPTDARDVDAVTEIWSRRALGPAPGRSVAEAGGAYPRLRIVP
ncbi:hypothetical protein [Pseudonocardia alni]|uniref:Uncharacterized protein n=1 Tax=Pseudonocardia alni TaxID=33907 RepID=A0A852W3D4_PSEA5|nr:hypothetical protein [Pseudonocardia antarctica]NYG00895.1 hypothetical protein [Pseudonocardia antarctica]